MGAGRRPVGRRAWGAVVLIAVVATLAGPASPTAGAPGVGDGDGDATRAPAGWPDPDTANQALGGGVQVVTPVTNYPTGGEQISAADGAAIAASGGFTSIRYAVPFPQATGPAPDYTIDPAFLAMVDAELDTFLAAGHTVVLEYVGGVHSEERFTAIWEQVAEHFADRPPQVYFELANEPLWAGGGLIPDFSDANILGPEEWNPIVAATLPVVRATNPYRTVVVSSPDVSHPQSVPDLELPDDDHLIVTFHQYQPLELTHQGAGWLPGADEWLGTTWSGRPDEVAALQATMAPAVCWSRATGVPLWMSEFGTFHLADLESRVQWTEAVARLAEGEGMAWTYFELSSDGFGIWDRTAGAWREPLYRALMPTVPPSPESWADCAAPPPPPPPDPGTCRAAGDLEPDGLALITEQMLPVMRDEPVPYTPSVSVTAPATVARGEAIGYRADIDLGLDDLVTEVLEERVRPVVLDLYGAGLASTAYVTMDLAAVEARIPVPDGTTLGAITATSSTGAAVPTTTTDDGDVVLQLGDLHLDSRTPVPPLAIDLEATVQPAATTDEVELVLGPVDFDLDVGVGVLFFGSPLEGHVAGPWGCAAGADVLARTVVTDTGDTPPPPPGPAPATPAVPVAATPRFTG